MLDFKKTLDNSGLKRIDIAKHFNVDRQLVNHWLHKHLPKSWELLLIQYFSSKGIKIYYKEEKKNIIK